MAGFLEDRDRRVVPRWRTTKQTIQSGETASLRPRSVPVESSVEHFEELLHQWSINRSLSFAADLVSAAVVIGKKEDAQEAARDVLADGRAPLTARRLAQRVLGLPPEAEVIAAEPQTRIHGLKLRTHEEPRNVFLWVDLAREYDTIGQRDQATRMIDIALRLAKTNRFVIRAASRHFLHAGEPGRAHDLLRTSPLVSADPWVLAAEIATASAARRVSKFIKKGRHILDSSSINEFDKSELYSAIASLELDAGGHKKARRLFESSLAQPTENAVAQAVWVKQVRQLRLLLPNDIITSHEGLALEARSESNWDAALAESGEWLCDQPFSSRPAIFGSYLAGIAIGDYEQAVQFARCGRDANPDEFLLRNNLAFSLFQLGGLEHIEEGSQLILNIDPESLHSAYRVVLLATRGLLSYKLGRPQEGFAFYQASIALAQSNGMERAEVLAQIYVAMEESKLHSPRATELKGRAVKLADALPDPELKPLLGRLERLDNGSQA